MKYEPTIGLEIHAELKTRTKMFCDCLNDPDEKKANVNVCPVCLAHPGTLPVPNKKAIESVIRVGLALGSEIAVTTKFDRKNYFYPDIPKGYQISQYDQPLVSGGTLNGVRITRVHLEEDTGSLSHAGGASLVDYNRAGVPLMELVTEPDIKNAKQASDFARELQLILRYLGVSDANMEKGQMRIEANISVSAEPGVLGTKVECKNINSFKAVEDAIEYEIKRQVELLEKGEKVRQATRGWDEVKHVTVHQRFKEDAHDYRYFPEPDIPPFETSIFSPEILKAELPELPTQKRERFAREYGLDMATQADMLVVEPPLAVFFEAAVSELREREPSASVNTLFNYLTSDLRGLMQGTELLSGKITPEHLAHLAALVQSGKIGSRQAKDILAKMVETGDDPEEIMEAEGLHTVSDEGELEKTVQEVLAENPVAVEEYKKGKVTVVQFMIGKAMGKLRGRGNPETLKTLFEKNLK